MATKHGISVQAYCLLKQGLVLAGVDPDTQQEVEVKLPSAIGQALESLGIARYRPTTLLC